jgi:hypothetical protein
MAGQPVGGLDTADLTARANNVDSAPSITPKSGKPLFFSNQLKHRQVLTDPVTQGDVFLRLLDIIQVEHLIGNAGNNRVAPAINVEIVQDEGFNVEILSAGAQITAVSLSVGAVWWALRAGGLFTSLLTSLPAWRSFDVLPVLSRDDDEDDESWELGDEPPEDKDDEHKDKCKEELRP